MKTSSKNVKLKNIIISLVLIIFASLTINVYATKVTDYTSTDDLANLAKTSSDFWKFNAGSMINKYMGPGNYNNPNEYCIAHNYGNRGSYKIVNIIDIANNDATKKGDIVVYSNSHKDGVAYSFDNKNVEPILYLASLAKNASKNNEQGVSIYGSGYGLNKYAMIYPFIHDKAKMELLGIDKGMFTGNMQLSESLPNVEKVIEAAKKEAQNVQKLNFELNMSEQEKSSVSVETKNGKTYIGPYKVSKASCKIEKAEIKTDSKTITIKNIATSLDGKTKDISEISDAKFWLVSDEELSGISSIKLYTNKVQMSKARIVLCYASYGQNFIVYKGEDANKSLEVDLPTVKYGKLKIKKVDNDDKTKALEGIGFKVYSQSKQNWVKVENNNMTFVNFDNATEFKTGKNGYTQEINKLPLGKYAIYETSIPQLLQDTYQLTDTITLTKKDWTKYTRVAKKIKEQEIKSSSEVELTATNKKAFVDLQIKKVDETTGQNLQGIGFKIYNKAKQGWLKVDSSNKVIDYVDFDKATLLVTDSNGLIKLNKVLLGKYMIVETDLGPYSDIYKLGTFRFNGSDVTGNIIEEDYEVKANSTGVVTVTAKNKQAYIALSGYVWQDITGNYDNKTEQQANGIYDDPDYKMNGVTVVLKDKQGNIVKDGNGNECKTVTKELNGKNGYYRFEKIDLNEIKQDNYYVEFTYDGLTYQCVIPKINEDAGSKASETEKARNDFNEMFATITGEGQTINGHELKYNSKTENGVSNVTLTNARTISSITKKGENNKQENVVEISNMGDFTIDATTISANYSIKAQYEKLQKQLANQNKLVTEIENINLGLYERGQTDLSLVKDVYSAKLSINGYNHIYEYGKYFNYVNEPRQESDFNVAMQWKKERTGTYTGPIYKSDINYVNDDKSKELKVSVTYAIDIRNENANTDRTVKVNQIVDYFDAKYEKTGIKVGTAIDETTGEVTGELSVSNVENVNSKYNKITIDTTKLGEIAGTGENHKTIYVKFDLSKAQIAEILNGEQSNAPLDNVAEITSYSTLQNGKPYAAIDKDSIPNNSKIGEENTYEDDTDKAPSFVLHPEDDRTLSGTVFIDNAKEFGKGNVRQGNGMYDEGEQGISGIKVVMTEVDKDGNKTQGGKTYEAITNDQGYFEITGYTPSYYKIEYTWGKDQGYDVKEYKGTVVLDKQRFSKLDWYKTESPRYSDATDDYQTREAIDAAQEIKQMTSTTPIFGVGIDKDSSVEPNITTTSDGDKFVRQDAKYLDFGIIERAKQSLDITKTVDTVKITDASGRVLVDAKVNSEGKLEGQVTGVTGGPSYGYIRAEIDNEIIQGSTAQIGYKITVANNGEVDYADENFYKYGEIPANDEGIIKIKPTNIYDYLDNDMKIDEDVTNSNTQSTKWTYKTTSEVEKSEIPTLMEQYFMSSITSETKEDGTVIVKGLEKVSSETMKKLFEQWLEEVDMTEEVETTSILTKIRALKLNDRQVLEIEGKELSPKDAPLEYNLYSTSLLSNSDEIRLDNETEITDVDIVKNKNGSYEKIPGRNISVEASNLYHKAEWVSVTPPTGENKDFIMILIISISAAIIIGTGIVFIKKKVLK